MSDNAIILHSEIQRQHAYTRIANLPLDGSMEVVFRAVSKKRSARQNSLMWSNGLIASIAEQAWVQGRQFSSSAWHEWFKQLYLPEGNEADYDRMVLAGYQKWTELPNGERKLTGSSARLSEYGMNQYIQKIEAYAACELGVKLPAQPMDADRF